MSCRDSSEIILLIEVASLSEKPQHKPLCIDFRCVDWGLSSLRPSSDCETTLGAKAPDYFCHVRWRSHYHNFANVATP
jgi:hypothetical protein